MLKKEELEKIKAHNALCELAPYIKINGVTLDYFDFGDKYDTDEENAEPYCCENMQSAILTVWLTTQEPNLAIMNQTPNTSGKSTSE